MRSGKLLNSSKARFSSSKLAALLSAVAKRHNSIDRTRESETKPIVLRTLFQSPFSAARNPTRKASLGMEGTMTGENVTGTGVTLRGGTKTPPMLGTVWGEPMPELDVGWAETGVAATINKVAMLRTERAELD